MAKILLGCRLKRNFRTSSDLFSRSDTVLKKKNPTKKVPKIVYKAVFYIKNRRDFFFPLIVGSAL